MGIRPLRAFQSFRHTFRKPLSRRWQSSAQESAQAQAKPETNNPFSWNSPVGPKTVHFWYVFQSPLVNSYQPVNDDRKY
jgi:hypothetical protein